MRQKYLSNTAYHLQRHAVGKTVRPGTVHRLRAGTMRPGEYWEQGSISARAKRSSLLNTDQTGSRTRPAQHALDTGSSFRGNKAADKRN